MKENESGHPWQCRWHEFPSPETGGHPSGASTTTATAMHLCQVPTHYNNICPGGGICKRTRQRYTWSVTGIFAITLPSPGTDTTTRLSSFSGN